jgi:hypothetical protein
LSGQPEASRPTQFDVHWYLMPGHFTLGWTTVECTELNGVFEVAA